MSQTRFLPIAFVSLVLGVLGSAGCSDDVKPVKQVVLRSSLKGGAAGAAKCGYGPPATWVDVLNGESDAGNELPVQDGNNNVRIVCRVAKNGDAFTVDAQVQSSTVGGGTVSIQGRFTASGPQAGIRALFQKGDGSGTFEQKDCTAQYTQSYMGVAGGRVWAELDCPKMVHTGGQDRECAGTANFRFENCDQ